MDPVVGRTRKDGTIGPKGFETRRRRRIGGGDRERRRQGGGVGLVHTVRTGTRVVETQSKDGDGIAVVKLNPVS